MFTKEEIELAAYHNYLYRRRGGDPELSTQEQMADDWIKAINHLLKLEELRVWKYGRNT